MVAHSFNRALAGGYRIKAERLRIKAERLRYHILPSNALATIS